MSSQPEIEKPSQGRLIGDHLAKSLAMTEFARKRQRIGCGVIEHVFVAGQDFTVTKEFEYRGNRGPITLLELGGEDTIAISAKHVPDLPSDVVGTIATSPTGTRWTSHQRAEAFEKQWAESRSIARDAISQSWKRGLRFDQEERDASGDIVLPGLRLPQVGALHAALGHWSLSNEVATVVMPTGTGKTETMVALMVASRPDCLLVVVPTLHLVDQTVNKFLTFGFLRHAGNISSECQFPIVGRIVRRPKTTADLEIFNRCNVVVAPIGTIAQGTALCYLDDIATRCSQLIIDEAHHVPANTWAVLREAFIKHDRPVLQFTATPFRIDRRLIDGRIIYNYPLATAMSHGYFTKIDFSAVSETASDRVDLAIATKAIEILRTDLAAGRDHLLLARVKTTARADEIAAVYQSLAPEFQPIAIHSKMGATSPALEQLRKRGSRIVVCAEMLKEGFDLSNLKIAAIHDKQQSLGVLLQFVGRFTRTGGKGLGNATVVANIESEDVADALEALYTEDADWNKLLADFSFTKVTEKQRLLEFLRKSVDLTDEARKESPGLPKVTLRAIAPRFSAVSYQATTLNENEFYKGLPENFRVLKAWYHAESKTLTIAGSLRETPKWSQTPVVVDETWHVLVCHLVTTKALLFIHTSIPDYMPTKLAEVLTGQPPKVVSGDVPFRILGRVNRLAYQQVGLTRRGRRSLSYSRHAGSDIGPTLERTEDGGSTKNDIFGSGYEGGHRVGIGASKKGKLWSRSAGPVQKFVDWAEAVAGKLTDDTINVEALISSIAVATPIATMPETAILSIEWPYHIRLKEEQTYEVMIGNKQYSLLDADLAFVAVDPLRTGYQFSISVEGKVAIYQLALEKTKGFSISQVSGESVTLRRGHTTQTLTEYFDENPPIVLFVDLSDLEGCDYYAYRYEDIVFDSTLLNPRDWSGVDIQKESRLKGGFERTNSIQSSAIEACRADGFSIVYDDDGANEVADLVCFKETADELVVRLVHCKYSAKPDSGGRLTDVEVLASQISRSARWLGDVQALEKRIRKRDGDRRSKGVVERFVVGDLRQLRTLVQSSRYKVIRKEIVAVQPGLSKKGTSENIGRIFSAAARYVADTAEAKTTVWCSE